MDTTWSCFTCHCVYNNNRDALELPAKEEVIYSDDEQVPLSLFAINVDPVSTTPSFTPSNI
jgi:hypothetical protein